MSDTKVHYQIIETKIERSFPADRECNFYGLSRFLRWEKCDSCHNEHLPLTFLCADHVESDWLRSEVERLHTILDPLEAALKKRESDDQ